MTLITDIPQSSKDVILPLEVLKAVIDIAVTTLDLPSISSIALLSHHFRIFANNARFSSISFFSDGASSLKRMIGRIHKLADLIHCSEQIQAMSETNTFITSFDLRIAITGWDPLPFWSDGSLALIFNSLFRHPNALRSRSRKLCLVLLHNMLHPWDLLDKSLSGSLSALIKTSHLNDLRLERVYAIPLDFIRGSKIQHLSLANITFDKGLAGKYPSPGVPVFLKSLCIQLDRTIEANDPSNLIGNQSRPTPDTFSHLTALSVSLITFEGLGTMGNILKMTRCLQSFTVVCLGLDGLLNHLDVHYDSLLYLKTLKLEFEQYCFTDHNIGSLSSAAIFLGDSVPPQLNNIDISIKIIEYASGSRAVSPEIARFHEAIETWDRRLASAIYRKPYNARFGSHAAIYFMVGVKLASVTITMNEFRAIENMAKHQEPNDTQQIKRRGEGGGTLRAVGSAVTALVSAVSVGTATLLFYPQTCKPPPPSVAEILRLIYNRTFTLVLSFVLFAASPDIYRSLRVALFIWDYAVCRRAHLTDTSDSIASNASASSAATTATDTSTSTLPATLMPVPTSTNAVGGGESGRELCPWNVGVGASIGARAMGGVGGVGVMGEMDEETSDNEDVDEDVDADEVERDLKRTASLKLGAHPGARAFAPYAPSPFLKILSCPPSSFSSARTTHTSYTPPHGTSLLLSFRTRIPHSPTLRRLS
ncbi:hypothetical protein CVT25_015157 [Psilocybe cyanescens]|uniref:Uncharacterized protein n=1 Tax=Psilocybe cyanescens TaxID=93625 RepID=A0A409X235_PSICY|nr:hypothetical protein CVT25_015157 [Psilocybe cyanescens]